MESLSGCHYVVRCEQIDFQGPYIYHVSTFCTFSEASIHYLFQHKYSTECQQKLLFSYRDEFRAGIFQLERARAVKFLSRAEHGQFNFRAETELTILTICRSKNSKFLI